MPLTSIGREHFQSVITSLKLMADTHRRNWELLSATNIPEELDRRRDLVRRTVSEYEMFINLDRISHELQVILEGGGL